MIVILRLIMKGMTVIVIAIVVMKDLEKKIDKVKK